MIKIRFAAVLLTITFSTLLSARQGRQDQPPKTASTMEPSRQTFIEYCAPCHGAMGKGNGPAASAFKRQPADLTTLAARNGGKFPEMKVIQAIKAGPGIPAHGSEVMPVWGPIFMDVEHSAGEREAQLKIYNLMEYIKTLQTK